MRWVAMAAAAMGAATAAQAEDWRAVSYYGRDIALVDADSVRRRDDGRLSFDAKLLLGEDNPSGDFGYDAYTLRAETNCTDTSDERAVRAERKFFMKGKPVEAPGWNSEDAADNAFALSGQVCRGLIGYRAFPAPEAALGEYRDHRSVERLTAWASAEAELSGTVFQGFEMNGIALCGSEAGCSERAESEFCWLEGPIEVPVPAGADVNSSPMRRDVADLAFRGRILRSSTGRGFGHVGAYGCLVEATGPTRPASLPPRPAASMSARGALGRGEPAIAAHAALDAAFGAVGAVVAAQDGKSWPIDALKARPSEWEAACGSDLMKDGHSLDPYPTAIMWGAVDSVGVSGPTLEIRTSRWSGLTEFHVPNAGAAQALRGLIESIAPARVGPVEQSGGRLRVGLSDGRRLALDQATSAEAVRLAGLMHDLRGKEVHSVTRQGRTVLALLVRRVSLTFEDEARALGIAALLEPLMRACRPAAS